MAVPDAFVRHFSDRADLAENLFSEGWYNEAYLVATVALDSLTKIWRHDVKEQAGPQPLEGKPALALNELLDTFAPGDVDAPKVAVVLFAEDLKRHRPPPLSKVANRLLQARGVEDDYSPTEAGMMPRADLDCSPEELLRTEPLLRQLDPMLLQSYRYPAYTYRFVRSSIAHAHGRGSRVNRFTDGRPSEEVDYFLPYTSNGTTNPMSLGIGVRVITRWVRTCVRGYVQHYQDPARGFDPSEEALRRLERLWG